MTPKETTKILFLGLEPADYQPLQLTRESQEITDALRRTTYRDHFVVCQEWGFQAQQLPGLLMCHAPKVVHMSGHGDLSGQLLFPLVGEESAPADMLVLSKLFELFKDVRCVVLNACRSAEQARMLARHVNVVIGVDRAIGDEDAIAFSRGFYEAVGQGMSVADAFRLGRSGIGLALLGDADALVLYTQSGVDAAQVWLHRRPGKRGTREELEKALREFFLGIFGPTDLRQRISYLPNGRMLQAELPDAVVPPAQLAGAVAKLVIDRTALSQQWFDDLAEEIQGRASDIANIARVWADFHG